MAVTINSYSAIIGSFDTGSFVDYYVSATDDSPKKNTALNDNNGQYYNFLVSTVTTASSTTPSGNGSGFGGIMSLLLIFLGLSLTCFLRRKKLKR